MVTLADELGALRDTIRALKAREAEIKTELTSGRVNDLVGAKWRIVLKTQKSRRLDKDKLPQEIIENMEYYTTSTSTIMRVYKVKSDCTSHDDDDLIDDNG